MFGIDDAILGSALTSVAAPVIGGIIGSSAGSRDRDNAQTAIKDAYNKYLAIGYPPDLAKEITYKQFVSVGKLNPVMEQELDLFRSSLGDYQEDQGLLGIQQQALADLKARASTGLTAQDRLNMMDIKNQINAETQARNAQMLQNLQSRGMGGSGAELASMLSNQQVGSNLMTRQGLQQGAQNQQASMQALGQLGSLSGQMRGADLAHAQTTRGAKDVATQFNLQNSMGRQARNVASLNEGQRRQLESDQNIANMNTQQYNQEQLRQRQEQGNYYDRLLRYQQGANQLAMGQAQNYQNEANRKAGMWTGIGSAVGSAAGNLMNYNLQKKYIDKLGGSDYYEGFSDALDA